MSPQALHEDGYSLKTDVWSLGCVIFELLTGKIPFTGKNRKDFYKNVDKGDYKIPEDIKPSDQLLLLISSCLVEDEDERISIEEVEEHPFLQS